METEKVMVLKFTIGLSSGHCSILGVFTNQEALEEAITKHSAQCAFDRSHYKVIECSLNELNELVCFEW